MQKEKNIFKMGFTLVETLVAIAILLIGTAATTMLFSKMMQSKAYSLEMGRSAFVVSRSVGDLTQYLRQTKQSDAGAYPIVSASDNDIVFYSNYNKDSKTERLHVYLSNNKVYMGVRSPSATFPVTYATGDESTTQLADHIVNTSSDHMFSYYNKDYPADTTHNPVATPANVSEIRLVKIFLKINIDPNRAPDNIQQETFVELRNLNDYDRIH
jgi:prepilin-type N-terminal cleavage/methylation domain-containing protein